MSIAAAAKAIQKEHGIDRPLALRLARDTAATMPGDPPSQAIIAEARYIVRRVREGKPTYPLGSGIRFRRQVEAILSTFEARGEPHEGKGPRGRASAMAARQMRDAYGDDYVQFLASLGKRRATAERSAEAEGKLVRLPQGRHAGRPGLSKAKPKAAPLRKANPSGDVYHFARELEKTLGQKAALAFAGEQKPTQFWHEVYYALTPKVPLSPSESWAVQTHLREAGYQADPFLGLHPDYMRLRGESMPAFKERMVTTHRRQRAMVDSTPAVAYGR